MTIQSLTGKPNAVVSPSKPASSEKSQNAELKSSEKPKDSIDITTVAKEITKAFESSKTAPVINQERVNAVKKALENGTYPINAERIAEKMIQMEHEQFSDSR